MTNKLVPEKDSLTSALIVVLRPKSWSRTETLLILLVFYEDMALMQDLIVHDVCRAQGRHDKNYRGTVAASTAAFRVPEVGGN
ncbi:hypothetical protein V6N11_069469 [Hibiscus sabdariffa]|uniref:Uncharacterized protein n=2 Tax=Hibiscus sabdariffa TaxID=183260 RepID=A0ABR2A462_9ROSI